MIFRDIEIKKCTEKVRIRKMRGEKKGRERDIGPKFRDREW